MCTPGRPRSGEQRERNVHVKEGVSERSSPAMRTARTRPWQRRAFAAVDPGQYPAGKFPPAEANGVRYLTIPVKLKGGAELVFDRLIGIGRT